MSLYTIDEDNGTIIGSDGKIIPADDSSASYKEYVVWLQSGNTPEPANVDIVARRLSEAKLNKIKDFSDRCQLEIIAGFNSDALGYLCIYDSGELDQLNLIGAVTSTAPTPVSPSGYDTPYAVRPVVNGVEQPKTYVVHTHYQLRKVIADGSSYKLSKLSKFSAKRSEILNNLHTIEEVNNFTW